MRTSTTSTSNGSIRPVSSLIKTFQADALPPSPIDVFARHAKLPGHVQAALNRNISVVGAGALGSWTALQLVRAGAQSLSIMDSDMVDPTNLPRQLFFADDLFESKASGLGRNLQRHLIAGGRITSIALSFQETIKRLTLPADVLVVGVDNNACRLACSQWARKRRIPAVFTMVSQNGMRCHVFLQGPNSDDACLWCALPNLNPLEAAPCAASAIISSCFLASAFAVFFTMRALMGWPAQVQPFNWREADLLGTVPDRTGMIKRCPRCTVCGRPEAVP